MVEPQREQTAQHVGDELRARIAHAVIELLDRSNRTPVQARLIARSGLSIETALFPVIVTVGRNEPVRVAEAAEIAGINASTMSRHAAALERIGAIERRLDPTDGRGTLLALTPLGRDAFDRIFAELDVLFQELLAEWSAEELTVFSDQLERFVSRVVRTAAERDQTA
jgi:DNA-binding MarR family transcriptional regulator